MSRHKDEISVALTVWLVAFVALVVMAVLVAGAGLIRAWSA